LTKTESARRREHKIREWSAQPPPCYETLEFQRFVRYSKPGKAALLRFADGREEWLPLFALRGLELYQEGHYDGRVEVLCEWIKKKGLWDFQGE